MVDGKEVVCLVDEYIPYETLQYSHDCSQELNKRVRVLYSYYGGSDSCTEYSYLAHEGARAQISLLRHVFFLISRQLHQSANNNAPLSPRLLASRLKPSSCFSQLGPE